MPCHRITTYARLPPPSPPMGPSPPTTDDEFSISDLEEEEEDDEVRPWREIQAQRKAQAAAREVEHRAMMERTREGRLAYVAGRREREAEQEEAPRKRQEKGKWVIVDLTGDGEDTNRGAGRRATPAGHHHRSWLN